MTDEDRVKLIRELENLKANRAIHAEMHAYQAWSAMNRYKELLKVGFTEAQALDLCARSIQF